MSSNAVRSDGGVALCSVGVGPHAGLLRLAQPTLELFAQRHNYDLHLSFRPLQRERPPAWDKILALQTLLQDYATVIWIDADAVVVNADEDITMSAPSSKSIWITKHHYDGEEQPNTGVMVLHRSTDTLRLLESIWNQRQYILHPWWEQAALLDLIGYDVSQIGHAKFMEPTEFTPKVGWLSNMWNSIPLDSHPNAKIKHYAGVDHTTRTSSMSEDLRKVLRTNVVTKVEEPQSASVIFPLLGTGPEAALLSLAQLTTGPQTIEVIIVDNGSHLKCVDSALTGSSKMLTFTQAIGLAGSWYEGIREATEEVIILFSEPVRTQPDSIGRLLAKVEPGAATTGTLPCDAGLQPSAAQVIAVSRQDLLRVYDRLLGVDDSNGMAALCMELAAIGCSVSSDPTAVFERALPVPPPPSPQSAIPPWLLSLSRGTYATACPRLPMREDFPRLLEALSLGGTGAEIGVQEGLFSHYILTYWGGERLISIDAWEHFDDGSYVDIANVEQDMQDEKYRLAQQRLAVFGSRSEIWKCRSTEAASRVEDGSLDFVYLDACHDYAGVLDDLAAWFPKVKPGGLIAGHDYLDGPLAEGEFGLKRAVDEFFGMMKLSVQSTMFDEPRKSWYILTPSA